MLSLVEEIEKECIYLESFSEQGSTNARPLAKLLRRAVERIKELEYEINVDLIDHG